MTATHNNLRAATAALSAAAIILLAVILLVVRPIPAFAEENQAQEAAAGNISLSVPTELNCFVKANGQVITPEAKDYAIANTGTEEVMLDAVTVTANSDSGPISLSAEAFVGTTGQPAGTLSSWFSYSKDANGLGDVKSQEKQILQPGQSLLAKWNVGKLNAKDNANVLNRLSGKDGFALATVSFTFKPKQAFAVLYDDGSAVLYKRCVKQMPAADSDLKDGVGNRKVRKVIQNIEDLPGIFSGEDTITTVEVKDSGIQPKTTKEWFKSCKRLTSIDLTLLDTSKVTDMGGMFYLCESLKSLDLSKFNTSNVTKMDNMFIACPSLESLNLSSFNTENVTTMRSMFNSCSSLNVLNVSGFNTSNVTDMAIMFDGCEKLTTLDISNFDTSQVTDTSFMFGECSSLVSLNVSGFNTSNVTKMDYMFYRCRSLGFLDLKGFSTESVQGMSYMFQECTALKKLDISSFNTKSVTTMWSMFNQCTQLEELLFDVSKFNTSNVTEMGYMFYLCGKLKQLDVSKFNTSKVEGMSCMFYGCSTLKVLDVSNFDAQFVKSTWGMFRYCSGIQSLVFGKQFNTSKVQGMEYMFDSCSGLTSLDLSNFDTSSVESMSYMFCGCSKLVTLRISNFNTSNVVDMQRMFNGCIALNEIDFSTWNVGNQTNAKDMFLGAKFNKLTIGYNWTHNLYDECNVGYQLFDEFDHEYKYSNPHGRIATYHCKGPRALPVDMMACSENASNSADLNTVEISSEAFQGDIAIDLPRNNNVETVSVKTDGAVDKSDLGATVECAEDPAGIPNLDLSSKDNHEPVIDNKGMEPIVCDSAVTVEHQV